MTSAKMCEPTLIMMAPTKKQNVQKRFPIIEKI